VLRRNTARGKNQRAGKQEQNGQCAERRFHAAVPSHLSGKSVLHYIKMHLFTGKL
jgi:hypothetical protein